METILIAGIAFGIIIVFIWFMMNPKRFLGESENRVAIIARAMRGGSLSDPEADEFDKFLWGKLEDIGTIVKEMGQAYKEEQKIFDKKGTYHDPKQMRLLDKLDTILLECQTKLEAFTAPEPIKDKYFEFGWAIQDYKKYAQYHRAFLKQLNIPQESDTPENRHLLDFHGKTALDSLNSAHSRVEKLKRFLLDEMKAAVKAVVDSSNEYFDENCKRFGISDQLRKPLFALAVKVLDVCEDCVKFSLKTFEIENTDENYISAYILVLNAASFIVEKVGNQATDNKLKLFGLVRPALCILLKNRDEHFSGLDLEDFIGGFETNKEKYEKMEGLIPEDNPDSAYDTVLGKTTALIGHVVGKINFESNKKAGDQLLEVTVYCQDKVDSLGNDIEQFMNQVLDLAKHLKK